MLLLGPSESAGERMQAESFTQFKWQQATLESLAAALITIDTQGRVVFMNSVAEELTGWPPSEARGRRVAALFHLVHQETGEVVENLAHKALRCARVTSLAEPTALIDRDERVRPIKASAKAIHDPAGRLLGAVLTIHDLTEQRCSEQQLKTLNKMLERRLRKQTAELEQRTAQLSACEKRLAMVLEANQAGYFEHTRSLESGCFSQRWAHLLGYQLDELPPLPVLLPWWGSRLHGQDRQRVMQAYRRFIEGRSEHFDIEYRIKHRRAGWRWQRLVSCAMQSEAAAPARVIAGLVFDITEQKHAARRLRKLDAALERCSARYHALAVQLSRAEQSERQGLAQLLHEQLQQKLVAALFNLSALHGRSRAQPSNEALATTEDLIRAAVESAHSLTIELSPPVLDQGRLSAALPWLAHWVEQRHGLHVRVQTKGNIDEISEHLRVLLFHAARELLFNVVKHAGVEYAHLRLSRQAKRIELEVSDHGVGIRLTREGHDRLGRFGLKNIRERLKACGGHLKIDRSVEQGTRVRLIAPQP